MRKIFAYLVVILTMLATMAFAIPKVVDTTNFAMEYTGGFEVLYKTASKTDNVKDSAIAKTISDGMKKLLDINGTQDAVVNVESGNYIRVNVTSKNQIVSEEIRDLLENPNSFKITFRDASDNLLATGDQILKEVGATYSGETNYYGYPIIYLNIDDTALLEDITTTVSNAEDKHLVIWVGFEEGVDSYANIETDSTTSKKVIYNATVSEPLNEDTITITGNYTEDQAKNNVNLVNSGTYKYDLETIQIKSVKASDASHSRTLLLISMAIAILVAIIAMVVFFRLEGLYAIVPVLFNEFLTVYLFNKIVGVVNPQVISAFILVNVLTFGLMFLLLHRYRTILKSSKSSIKAYRETYKKNGPIILDTCITVLLFAIVCYFVGTNADNFAILLATCSVATFATLYLIERLTMYLTCDFFNKNDKAIISSSNASREEATQSNLSDNIDKYTKPVSIGFFSLLGLGAIVALVMGLVFKAPFNFYSDAKQGSRIEIVSNQEYFTSEEQVMEFFDKEEMSVELKTIILTNDGDEYHVIVTTDESVAKYDTYLKSQLVSIYGENTDYEENYVLYVNDYNPTSLLISFESTLYTTGLAVLLVAVYFALRYKYSYALATLASIVMTVSSIVAFFALTRLPVNSQTVIAILTISTYSLFILVPLFTRIREYMNDTKKPYLSYEERIDCFKRGRNSIFLFALVVTGILDFITLVAMFFDLNNFATYLAIILASFYAFIFNMVIVPKVWILFENRRDRRRKTFKNKNIANSKYRTLDEQVFIGVND